MKRWFLYRVYKVNKGLFVFFILFLSGTLVTNLLGWQVTPFFVWGMYSEKEDTSNYPPVVKVTVNDSIVINPTRYTDANKFFLTAPFLLYVQLMSNGEDPGEVLLKRKLGQNYSTIQSISENVLNDPKQYNLFFPWYKRYLAQTTRIKINTCKIELLNAAYVGNKVEIISPGK